MTRIVVGVDGSPASIEALRWALREAGRIEASVVAVHAWNDVYAAGAPYTVAIDSKMYSDAAHRVLDRAIADVCAEGEASIERRVVRDGAANAILEAAEGADLLVVGSRGRGGFAGLLLGSVSQQVVHHARCPVVVIPEGWHPA